MAVSHVIAIVGPTASGKSPLGVSLARRFHGSIINADSRQIYRGLHIATAQPSPGERRAVPHYLFNIARPDQTITLAEYQRRVFRLLTRLSGPVFLVGGTGLYVSAIIENWAIPSVPPNHRLRLQLEKQTNAALFLRLKKLDTDTARIIDRHNKRRLVRALEVVLATGQSFTGQKQKRPFPYPVLVIGLNPADRVLRQRIARRTNQMFRSGLVAETKRLQQKYDFQLPALSSLGYADVADYRNKHISLAEAKRRIETKTWQYSRRQLTWFRKVPNIAWIRSEKRAATLTRRFLMAEKKERGVRQ